MKTSIKRLVCVLFCLCMLISCFAACGGKSGENGQANGGNNNGGGGGNSGDDKYYVDTGIDPYASIPANIKGQEVVIATWENIDNYNMKALETDTGIKAKVDVIPQNSYIDTLLVRIASGDSPDIFVDNDGTGFPLTLQIAQPIDVCSTVDLTESIWDQSLMQYGKINGHTYLVNTINSPWNGANMIYYNKALFDKLGEKTPADYYEEGNWTWDTLELMLKKITQQGYYGANINQRMLAGSAGASFITYDYKNGKFVNNVDSVELLSAYQTYLDWDDAGYLGGTMEAFREGNCAIYALGTFGLKSEGHWKDMDPADVGFTYFPAAKDGAETKVHAIYRMYGIVRGAKHANAAGYVLRHFLDNRNYDHSSTFISDEARDFYFEITGVNAEKKYFTFDDHCGALIGLPEYTISKGATSATSKNDVATEIKAVNNQVNKAVEAANKLIEELKNKY